MAGQRETVQKTPLLDRHGRLGVPSWAAGDLFVYNKEHASRLHRREWDYYQIADSRFVFRLLLGTSSLLGMAKGELYDRETGARFVLGPEKLFPGDSYDLDYSAGEPHNFYRDVENFFLKLDFDGDYHRLRCRAGAFDVELMLPEKRMTLSTLSPFGRRKQFCFLTRRLFPELRGRVKLNGQEYTLGSDAFALLDSGRGVMPGRLSRCLSCAFGSTEGHSLGILLGWGFGYAGSGSENALFVDGNLLKLNRVREQRKEENFMSPSRFYTDDGRIELIYTPEEQQSVKHRLPLSADCRRTVGTVSGRIILSEEEKLTVDRLPMLCEHTRLVW